MRRLLERIEENKSPVLDSRPFFVKRIVLSGDLIIPETEYLPLIQAYEAKHFPMDLPDPVEAIKFVMEQRNLTVQDLLPVFGRPNRAYEVLNGKRTLTLAMIRKLHAEFGIPQKSPLSTGV